jgi:hypothetical protein
VALPEHVTSVFINIGSNLDPILPPADYGNDAITIAFEPIVGCEILGSNIPILVVVVVVVVLQLLSTTSFWSSMRQYQQHLA